MQLSSTLQTWRMHSVESQSNFEAQRRGQNLRHLHQVRTSYKMLPFQPFRSFVSSYQGWFMRWKHGMLPNRYGHSHFSTAMTGGCLRCCAKGAVRQQIYSSRQIAAWSCCPLVDSGTIRQVSHHLLQPSPTLTRGSIADDQLIYPLRACQVHSPSDAARAGQG